MTIARTSALALLPMTIALLAVAGCSKPVEPGPAESTPNVVAPVTPPGPPGPSGAAKVPGRVVFESNNCSNCHSIAGQGGKGAPDLSKIGGEHDAQWIIAHVKNPKTHKPNSRMPSFEGKINETDLAALGAYLAGLK